MTFGGKATYAQGAPSFRLNFSNTQTIAAPRMTGEPDRQWFVQASIHPDADQLQPEDKVIRKKIDARPQKNHLGCQVR